MSERQIQVNELEEIIHRLPGVLSGKVIVNDWGAIEEIHVLASSDKNPKQLVRDIESALAAKWGIKLDHRKISVAQLELASPIQSAETVQLSELTLTNNLATSQLQVTVLVSDSGRKFKGTAQGLALTRDAADRLVAAAAVEAVNASLREPYRFTLEDVFTVTSPHGREIAVSVVGLVRGSGETTVLTGNSLMKGEEFQACVKSVLDAVNRQITSLPRRWEASVEDGALGAEEEKAQD
ncbi:MAG TPA: hypothetical protein GXX40_00585 [Firmicutes bacterium]|nr:hypothetical protein [Bacillota bacterium]